MQNTLMDTHHKLFGMSAQDCRVGQPISKHGSMPLFVQTKHCCARPQHARTNQHALSTQTLSWAGAHGKKLISTIIAAGISSLQRPRDHCIGKPSHLLPSNVLAGHHQCPTHTNTRLMAAPAFNKHTDTCVCIANLACKLATSVAKSRAWQSCACCAS